jgi:hypothetical protein
MGKMKEKLVGLKTMKLAYNKDFYGNNSQRIKLDYTSFKRFDLIPTQSLVQKWLREVHQIYVEVNTDCTTSPKFCYNITKFIGNPNDLSEKEWDWIILPNNENWGLRRKYENALEDGLKEALKLIK